MRNRILTITICLLLLIRFKYRARELALLYEYFTILLLLVSICIAPISNRWKCAMIAIVIIVYRINISILGDLLGVAYNGYKGKYIENDTRKDDHVLRTDVTRILSSHFRFTHNFDRLPAYPTIIVANYIYDRIENIACITIPKDLCIVMGQSFVKIAKLDRIIKNFIFRYETVKTGQYDSIKEQARQKLNEGFSIFAYVSKCTQYRNGYVGKVRSGMFRIAKELNVPVTPITIDFIKHNNGIIENQRFRIKVGETFKVDDIGQAVYYTRNFFRKTLKSFREK